MKSCCKSKHIYISKEIHLDLLHVEIASTDPASRVAIRPPLPSQIKSRIQIWAEKKHQAAEEGLMYRMQVGRQTSGLPCHYRHIVTWTYITCCPRSRARLSLSGHSKHSGTAPATFVPASTVQCYSTAHSRSPWPLTRSCYSRVNRFPAYRVKHVVTSRRVTRFLTTRVSHTCFV